MLPSEETRHIYREGEPMRPEIHPDHLDKHSGWLSARYEIVIRRSPEDIWDYVYDPEHWTASNPDEHMGLTFYNREDRPKTGVAFHQKESVAGVCADLYGHILFAERPLIVVWNGVARYRVFRILPYPVPEAGVVRLEINDSGTLVSHSVFLHIPRTLFGALLFDLSARFSKRSGFIPHTFKELLFFKRELEQTHEEAYHTGLGGDTHRGRE